jgi:hypothetical protein
MANYTTFFTRYKTYLSKIYKFCFTSVSTLLVFNEKSGFPLHSDVCDINIWISVVIQVQYSDMKVGHRNMDGCIEPGIKPLIDLSLIDRTSTVSL